MSHQFLSLSFKSEKKTQDFRQGDDIVTVAIPLLLDTPLPPPPANLLSSGQLLVPLLS